MPVYDDEKAKAGATSDDDLRKITGIGKSAESAMEDRAHAGAKEDLAKAEKASGSSSNLRDKIGDVKKGLGAAEAAGGGGVAGLIGAGFNAADLTPIGRLAMLGKIFWGSKNRKRATAGGGVAGATITAAFFFLSMASGPAQFLQIAHFMDMFHFAHMENQSDNRFTSYLRDYKKFKALKNGKDFERTRMGKIGNAIADHYEKKLASVGVNYETSAAGILTDGVTIDPAKLPETSEMEPEDAAKYLQEKYNLKELPEIKDGKLFIKSSDMGSFLNSNRLTRGLLQGAGLSKVSSHIASRYLDTRYGISWHYISNKLQQLQGESYNKWKKSMDKEEEDDVEKGSVDPVKVGDGSQDNGGACDTSAKGYSQAACDAQRENDSAGDSEAGNIESDAGQEVSSGGEQAASGVAAKIKGLLTPGKIIGGIGGLVGIFCILRSLNSAYNDVKMAQVIEPLIRFAAKFISIGSQVQSGNDMDANQLGYYSSMLYDNNTDKKTDPNAQTGWQDSQTQNAEEINAGMSDAPSPLANGTAPGVAPDNTLQHIATGSPLSWVGSIPGLGAACSGIGQFVISIFGGGPLKAVGQWIVGQILQVIPGVNGLIDKVVSIIVGWLAGAPVTAFPQGAQTGNYLNFGARLAGNAQAITAGGGQLSQPQVAQLDKDEDIQAQQRFASNSFADRIFNPYLPGSVMNKLASSINPDIATNVASLTTNFSSIFGSLIHSLSSLIARPSLAAGTVPLENVYGFPEYGFSDTEMQEVGSPLANSVQAATILDNNCINSDGSVNTSCDYIQRAQNCFHVSIDATKNPDGTNQWDVQVGSTPVDPYVTSGQGAYPSNCTDDTDSNWLSIRFFIFDTETMKAMGCYSGLTSCSDFGYTKNG